MDRRIPFFSRTLWYAVGVLLWHTMVACSENDAQENGTVLGSLQSIAVAGAEEEVVYIPEDNSFSVAVMAIRDSRCPSDVVCIWAGDAQVTFSIIGVGKPINLYIGAGGDHKASRHSFVFEKQSYELTLVDVTPYPSEESNHEIKKAHFKVRLL